MAGFSYHSLLCNAPGSGNIVSLAAAAIQAAITASEAAQAAARASGKGTRQVAIFAGQAAAYTVVALIDAVLGKKAQALAAASAAGGFAAFLLFSLSEPGMEPFFVRFRFISF